MNGLSHNELALVAAGIGYIALVGLFAVIMTRKGNRLLSDIREQGPEGLWEELGSPETLKEAYESENLSLRNFIRSGEYRTRCHPILASSIDDYRRFTNLGLFGLAALGIGIFIVFWPLLRNVVPHIS